jgi:hypothetical protein
LLKEDFAIESGMPSLKLKSFGIALKQSSF